MELRTWVVFGATSTIAIETLRQLTLDRAESGSIRYILVARHRERLELLRHDLKTRGANQVHTVVCDLANESAVKNALAEIIPQVVGEFVLLQAQGILMDQNACKTDEKLRQTGFAVNFLNVVSICEEFAHLIEGGRPGSIAVISSVAGDRGRQSNYFYGTSKGALTIYLQGLRNRLTHSDGHVLTIKPGFVATAMTAHLKQGLLFASPQKVAHDIINALKKRKDQIYSPRFWALIMLIICHIPERIFKKLSL